MNGAIAELDNMTSSPNPNSIRMIGSSHHYLLCFKKNQNSLTSEFVFAIDKYFQHYF